MEDNPITGKVLRVTRGTAGEVYVEALEELPEEAQERLTAPEVLAQLPEEAQERLTVGVREGLAQPSAALSPFLGSCRITFSPEPIIAAEPIIAGWRIAPRCIDDGCFGGCQLASIRVFTLEGEKYIHTCVCGPVA
jgi:hypothetical protein